MKKTGLHSLLQGSALLLCRLFLPALAVLFLVVLPTITPRQALAGSMVFDWVVRLALTAYFCVVYWGLPKLFEPGRARSLYIDAAVLSDRVALISYYLFMMVGYGFSTALFTYLAFSAFLPSLSDFRLPATVLNGSILIMAFVLKYKAFKELAARQL